jgi:hypothetical protein
LRPNASPATPVLLTSKRPSGETLNEQLAEHLQSKQT